VTGLYSGSSLQTDGSQLIDTMLLKEKLNYNAALVLKHVILVNSDYSCVVQQMGIIEDSAESVSAENIKEDNKQLQMKVDKNEKLIRQLHLEQTEHENVMKASSVFALNRFRK